MKRKIMQFRNPIFHNGINCTVRRGYKWANLKIGEKILLNTGEEVTIEKLIVCRYKDIKKSDLKYEHDPNCRVKTGLFKTLCDIYPNFDMNTVVTIVYFKYSRIKT